MTPIHRYEPGESAPADGRYTLVDHYGEATNISLWRRQGQRLPMVKTIGDAGPFWFVRIYVDEANELARVA